jgi:hypothetical protein
MGEVPGGFHIGTLAASQRKSSDKAKANGNQLCDYESVACVLSRTGKMPVPLLRVELFCRDLPDPIAFF